MEATVLRTELEQEAREAEEAGLQIWERVEERLGIDLEQMARESKALQRKRGIRSGKDLFRLLLFYVSSNWSLRLVGIWALLSGIGYLSDVAVLKRLRNSQKWIGRIVARILETRVTGLKRMAGVRLRVVDATTISIPGSQGIDWRLHLSFDLGNLCLDGSS